MEGALLCILLFLCCGAISAQDWKNVGSCGAGLYCGPQCQRLCLSQHNYYRSLHNSPPLKCDPHLALSAQAWADASARQKTVKGSTPSNDYVESISWKKWGWKGMQFKLGAIPGAVRSWYSELKRGYDYDTGTGNGIVTHFKSVIDSREARLGCGISIKPGDGAYVVAHYSLGPGKQFKFNDFTPTKAFGPRKEAELQCRLKSFEREQCGDLEGPFVTPDKCLKAGCCYDDIFMDEPGLQWHNPKATMWCFKRKSNVAAAPQFGIAHVNDAAYSGDTSWMNVGSCGQGLTCNPDCQLLCLKLTNYYRALHNSSPMKCDPALAQSAQEWTDQQAKAGKMYHSEWTDKFTESISWKGWGWAGMEKMEGAIPGAVRSWYSEIKNDYNYQTGKGAGVIGHFQAVVWNAETKLGCGLNIKPKDGSYVTAHYAPPSHVSMDKEKIAPDNVKPRKQPAPGCAIPSSQRVDCFGDATTETQKVPFVTPELCLQKGCCYDDMYMNEPDTWFYKPPGRTWCFKKQGGATGTPTEAPSTTLIDSSPTTRPSGASTTRPPGASTTRPSGASTTRPSGSVPQPAPPLAPGISNDTPLPTQLPGSSTTPPPSSSTTKPPGPSTTQPLGQSPTQPPGSSTTQPLSQSATQPPRPSTTQPPGSSTTQSPGPSRNQPPRSSTTQPPGPSTTQPPRPSKHQPPRPSPTKPPRPLTTQPPRSSTNQPLGSSQSQPPLPDQSPTEPPDQSPSEPPDQSPSEPPDQSPTQPPGSVPQPSPTGDPTPSGTSPVQLQSPATNSALDQVIPDIIKAVIKIADRQGIGENCFGNSCYLFAEEGGTWDENQQSCIGQGGDLVSIETPEEWEYINTEIQQITLPVVNEWHIGLENVNGWNWVSGERLSINKWQRGQPSGDGNVAVMSKDYPPGSQGLFNDLSRRYPKAYICEMPKDGTSQPAPAPPGNPTESPSSTPAPSGNPTEPPGTTIAPTAGGTTSASGQQAGMTGFEQDCLKAHNEYRAKHGTPPLKWNKQLAEDAQTWANELAIKNVFPADHDPNNKDGENLAWFSMSIPTKQCQGPKTSTCTQCREMVKDWYDEIKDWDFNAGISTGGVTTHFTQVVWKATTELGMATAMSANNFFTVARYTPKGNFGYPDEFKKNVPPLL